MKANKVYLVTQTSGSWDDFTWWICGIFENPLDAEKCCKDINDERQLERIELEEFAKKHLDVDSDGDGYFNLETVQSFLCLGEKEVTKIHKLFNNWMRLTEIHDCQVIEKDFNVRIKIKDEFDL